MSVSTVSPNFDLINISRTASVGLYQLVDSGTGFNINLNGSEDTVWAGATNPGADETRGAACNTQGGNYTVAGEVDWPNLVIPVPDDAIITAVEMLCNNLAYNISANVDNAVSAGTDNSGNAQANLDGLVAPGCEVDAPLTGFVPVTDVFATETDSDFVFSGASIAPAAAISEAGLIIRKVWDFTGEPGGGIDKATLLAQFTDVAIIIRQASAQATVTWLTGGGVITGTGEAHASFTLTTAQWSMTITWEVPYQYTVDPNPPANVEVGQQITIESDPLDPDALQLDELTIEYNGVQMVPTTQTANLFIFFIPDIAAGSYLLEAIGNGTQFSGSIPLGLLTILATNGSGLYVLIPGKANDTLYSSARDGTTVDVKIPDPFIKTGFIGG